MKTIGLKRKMADEDRIRNALRLARSVLREKTESTQIRGQPCVFWPLFLGEKGGVPPSEIDSCATSVGTMALLHLVEGDRSPQIQNTLQSAVKTVLTMRNEDGSWPSIVLLSTEQPPKMEGVLNDTTYALESLLELGFLDHTPNIPLDMTLDTRMELVLESIEWLLENRVGNGWHYTGIEYLESAESVSPSVLPTSNVIAILHGVIVALNRSGKIPDLVSEIEEAYREAIGWLRDIQEEGGGFGRKRGDRPTIVHTAIAVNALLTDGSEESQKKALDGIRWILRNENILSLRELAREDIFDEYEQIIFLDSGESRKRVINHENYLEGIVLHNLVEANRRGIVRDLRFRERYRYRKVVTYLLDELLARQRKSGTLQGAFESRRGTLTENYPIYALYFAVLALESVRRDLRLVLANPSARTYVSIILVVFTIILLATALMSWILDLSLEKAAGLFVVEIIGGLAASMIVQVLFTRRG